MWALLNESQGYLNSPNYQSVFPSGTECTWLIKVQWSYAIQLTLTFDLGNFDTRFQCPPTVKEGYLSANVEINWTRPFILYYD